MTNLTYDKAATNESILKHLKAYDDGFQWAEVFRRNDSQGYAAEHKDFVMVAFAGSDDTLDWLRNAVAVPRDVNGGKIHYGFSCWCAPRRSGAGGECRCTSREAPVLVGIAGQPRSRTGIS